MKQTINIGNAVDDGQGDYLRRGGTKINENFTELYDNLGDGVRPYAAGAWKTHTTNMGELSPIFGQSFTVNTTNGSVTVNLPKGTANDYNKSIKLRDVWRVWNEHPVVLIAAVGDTIKGSPNRALLNKDFMDVELVYCSPGRWEYVENMRVDKVTTSDLSTVAKREFIATQGQTDFVDIFGINLYNLSNTEVYLRGNLLYYGDDLTADSNYGSIDPANPTGVLPLDGKSIRLRIPCNAGDPVTIVTYMDGIASFRSTYNNFTIQAFQTGSVSGESVAGDTFIGDLLTTKTFTKQMFGVPEAENINPNSLEVFINGRLQMEAGTGLLPSFICEGASGETEDECINNSGKWVASGKDYSIIFDPLTEHVTGIRLNEPLETADFLTIKWYNNDIGTVMEWEGPGGVKEHTDKIYLNNEREITLRNRIEYTDTQNPSQNTVRPVPAETVGRLLDIVAFFDVVHPVGTIYENAHNPANPADYMGMGVWVPYSQGQFRAGWKPGDAQFGINNNHMDNQGQPSNTAGGTGGAKSVELGVNQIPEIVSKQKVLVSDPNGPIIIGGCQLDPDADGPGYTKYREDTLKVNDGNTSPADVNILPPYITTYTWLRIA